MRNKKRIPIICDALKSKKAKILLLNYIFESVKTEKSLSDLNKIIDIWNNIELQLFWENNIDLRLSQVLISSGIIDNYRGFWFYKECAEMCIDCGILNPEEILFWGQRYDKDCKLLPNTNYILLKNMEVSHIEKLLERHKNGEQILPERYLDTFNKLIIK